MITDIAITLALLAASVLTAGAYIWTVNRVCDRWRS